MKTRNTKKFTFLLLGLFTTILASAQVNYNFSNWALISGTQKQQGAVYRLSSVKANVDAIITIDKLTRSASLDSFDISEPGLATSLQPALRIAPHCWGYIQFNVQFVKGGTSIPVAITNMPAKGKVYNSNRKDVKVDVLRTSATAFKIRMYSANQHGYALNTKADMLLQTAGDENNLPSEAAVANFSGDMKGN